MAENRQQGYFDGLEAKHRKRVLLWGGVIVTLLAVATAFALWRLPEGDTPPRDPERSQPATSTPETTSTLPPGESSSGGDTTDPGGTGDAAEPAKGEGAEEGETPSKPAPGNSGWLSYRLDGGLWVATCDAADPRNAAPEEGVLAFEVSPDGRTLAIARRDGLELRDVRSGGSRRVTKVAAGGLSWSSDSRRLAFSSAGTSGDWEIRVVSSDGSGSKTLGTGALPKISPDGTRVAFMTGAMDAKKPLAVVSVTGGKPREVTGTASTLDFDWADDKALVVLAGKLASSGTPASATVRRVTLEGKSTDLFSSAVTAPIVTWMYLHASPDGRSVLFAEVGDDGYSRAHVLGPDKKLVVLGTRRDTYPVGWSADGKVLFVEGNSFQGEETDLMCAKADGTARRVLVSGASR